MLISICAVVVHVGKCDAADSWHTQITPRKSLQNHADKLGHAAAVAAELSQNGITASAGKLALACGRELTCSELHGNTSVTVGLSDLD